jgi:cell division protein FtsX
MYNLITLNIIAMLVMMILFQVFYSLSLNVQNFEYKAPSNNEKY